MLPPVRSHVNGQVIGDNAWLQIFDGCGHEPCSDDSHGTEKIMRHFLADHRYVNPTKKWLAVETK